MTVSRRRWRPLRDTVPSTDDTGSLAVALLLTLVGITLTGLLVPVVITQFGATRTAVQRLNALNAAQAGLDVAIGHIRAANDGPDIGRFADLPCSRLSGPAGPDGTASYDVTIDYLDPTESPVACGDRTTAYARLHSGGTDGSTTRSLNATYTFRTSNENIPGGLIHVFKTTSTDLCMDAGSASPAAGTNLRMQACKPGNVQQKFAYNKNLTLVLVASKTKDNPLGMCLDAGAHAVGNQVRFQPCADPTKSQQQWSINDSANFQGANDKQQLDPFCFNVQSPNTPNSLVVLATGSKCSGGYNNVQTFSPEASVGAGAAGAAVGQLMNYNQFGRCLDVTGTDVNSPFLIVWPCKQAPNPKDVLWNQKWTLPGTGTGPITTTHPQRGRHCLQSPPAPGGYVRVVPCPNGSTPPRTTWTVHGKTETYASSYRIEIGSGSGYCLAPSTNPSDFYLGGQLQNVSKVVTAPCDRSTLQKWNGNANDLQSGPLTDIHEE